MLDCKHIMGHTLTNLVRNYELVHYTVTVFETESLGGRGQ
jgi:hypothetical protein